MMGLESKYNLGYLTTTVDAVVNWARKNSLWPMPMGLSCCAIELMAIIGARFDVSRFGSEVLRFSPRQADLMIVAGTMTYKQASIVRKIFDQMSEPKWVIAMGTCLCTGGMFDSYSVVQGLDKVLPVDVYIPGCPPRPEGLLNAIIQIQKKIEKESVLKMRDNASYVPDIKLPARNTDYVEKGKNTMVLNMGPSHPATHGVLRIILELDGEVVVNAEPVVGYLHRGFEKIGENKTYHQFIPYTDRLDYLSCLSNNVAYTSAVEKLLNIDIPRRAKYIRVLICELARISSHLVALGVFGLDLGAMTAFFYSWHQRELIYDIIQELTGTRLTTSYTRIGGLARDIPNGLDAKVQKFLIGLPAVLDTIEGLLTNNKIWIDRTKGIGILTKETALLYGITGPNLRASGIPHDLRKDSPYLAYHEFNFNVITKDEGDCYARYLLRILEIKESIKIVEQVISGMPAGKINADEPKIVLPPKESVLNNMEELIHHFLISGMGINIEKGETYFSIESSKGELGFYIRSDGTNKPHRLRIKSPSFHNIQVIPELARGHMLADMMAIISSIDPVMGECDK